MVETRLAGQEPRPLGATRTVRGSEKVPKASGIVHRVSTQAESYFPVLTEKHNGISVCAKEATLGLETR